MEEKNTHTKLVSRIFLRTGIFTYMKTIVTWMVWDKNGIWAI